MSDGTASESALPSLTGQVIDGRYRLIKKLGEGGMGEVYTAEHVHIEKKFAIKLLRPEIVSNQEAVKRFYQEARSASSIGHRNIIGIEDFGQLADGRVYMCMELLNGAPLNDMIQHPMAVDRLLNIMIQTGHGLAAAHSKGIVHRDMKPENIYVTVGPNGEDIPKLLDFGIAKVSGNDGQNNLTRTGTIFGTPYYMAPEQALGNPVDARTDIYAMGVIMYEVFAGSLPFQGESFMGILTQHITTDPEPVAQRAAKANRQISPQLADIITRCVRKNPAERFASMDELVNALVPIYRGIAGAGMSTYMEAFPVSAQHPVAHTPGPMQHPTGHHTGQAPGGMHPTMMPGMPPPGMTATGGMAAPTGPHAMSSGHAPATASSSGLYDPSASVIEAPKKSGSKTGLIIAIVAVLAVGGGIAAFVVMNQGKTGAGSQVASATGDAGATDPKDPKTGSAPVVDPKTNPDPKTGSADSTDPKHANGSAKDPWNEPKTGSADPTTNGSAEDPKTGSGEPRTVPIDAGSVEPPVVDAPPAVEAGKLVLLSARNVPAFEVWESGKKVGDGPMNLEIPANGKRSVVIKAKGYKDRAMIVDAKKPSVQFSLDAKATVVVKPPNPTPTVNCANVITDPKNKACVKQYCSLHSSDSRCDLE